jgi:hypothetical protein
MARTGYLHNLALRARGQTPADAERGQALRPTNALLRRWEMLTTAADDGLAQNSRRAPSSGLTRSSAPTPERSPAAFAPRTQPTGVAAASGLQPPRPVGPAAADPAAAGAAAAGPGGVRSGAGMKPFADVAFESPGVTVEVGRVVRGGELRTEPGRGRNAFGEDVTAAANEGRDQGQPGTLMPARSRNLRAASDADSAEAEQGALASGRDAGETGAFPRRDFRAEPRTGVEPARGERTGDSAAAGTIWPRPPDRSARPEPAVDAGPTIHIGSIEIIVTPPANEAGMPVREPFRAAPAPTLQAAAPRAAPARPAGSGRLACGYLSTFGLRQG